MPSFHHRTPAYLEHIHVYVNKYAESVHVCAKISCPSVLKLLPQGRQWTVNFFKGCRMDRPDKVSLWYVALLINTRFRFFILELSNC